MIFDIPTLAFIECLIFVTQVIVLFVQYRVNRVYRGIGWWVLGSALMALGVIFMPLVTVKSLEILARFANPLLALGQIFLYVGVVRFIDKKENRWVLVSIFAIFIFSYYSYIYIYNDISARTVIINATLATIIIMTAYQLFFYKGRFISGAANFTATVFLIYGCLLTVRTIWTLMLPPAQSYSDLGMLLIVSFIIPIIASTLWTFGFIIMINQRLNIENCVEKEKLQQIFNTSPDASLITRLKDGLLIDVNVGFSVMTGYTHAEAIGNSTLKINLWHSIEERKIFLTEVNEKGICNNMEFIFMRKDGSPFVGIISSRLILIYDVPHVISVIHDITERKQAEHQIQQLVQQLENERNIAELNSLTDSLTGLANRRCFDDTLQTEFYRLKRSGSTLSLIMLDIDHFKRFNDSYGHLAGDDCLRQIGNTLKTIVLRVSDMVARYGGEEFVVILPETENDGAIDVAERIRRAIEELAIPNVAYELIKKVTVSLGIVTVYHTTGLESPEQVIALADEALYCAKKGGRNRIEVNFKTIFQPE